MRMTKHCAAAVSSLGRFRSTRGVLTTPRATKSGYVLVGIRGKTYSLHRLIATSFRLPKTSTQTEVNHINGIRHDNRLENLEWTTRSQNVKHSHDHLQRASSASRKSKPVSVRKCGDEAWVDFPSAVVAARGLRIHRSTIYRCLRGDLRHTKGYEFRYGAPLEPECLDGEEWRDLHDGARISSLGRFRSTVGIVSTPKPQYSGYVDVSIMRKTYYVHRLVAIAFGIPRAIGQDQVNHKNGNPSDNRVQNLEWISNSDNIQHSYDTNASRASNAATLAKPVRGRQVGTEEWTLYGLGAIGAARALGLWSGNVSHVCLGTRASTGGYEFQFVEEEADVLPGEEWCEL